MDSDEDFVEGASDNDLRDENFDHEDKGMAKRTRSRGNNNDHNAGSYSWEDEYQRTWDIVKEEDEGDRSLRLLVHRMIEARKKKILRNSTTPFQRGIIRTLVVIIDASLTMSEKDLRPTRFGAMLTHLLDFIVEFFDQNPISQLGIVMMQNGVAHLVSEVSALPQHHLDKIGSIRARQHNRFEPKGDPSLQNALELARSLLANNASVSSLLSSRNSREILVVFGALFTSDPGDIHKTIDSLVRDQIKVKVIGLSAQVAICREIVVKTNHLNSKISPSQSLYGVIINEAHFRELLMDCVQPLAITKPTNNQLQKAGRKVPVIRMGFPLKHLGASATVSVAMAINFPHLCACHPMHGSEDMKDAVIPEQVSSQAGILDESSVVGYVCPQCKAKVCQLPTICPVCGLMLILSTHLARSYHHLVPLPDYDNAPISEKYDSEYCCGCLLQFPSNGIEKHLHATTRYRCPKCQKDFCINCDVFIHETLRNCPGCEM